MVYPEGEEGREAGVLAAAVHPRGEVASLREGLSTRHRNEYVEWITEAKRKEARAKRLETALEWLAEGKSRNWKYEKC